MKLRTTLLAFVCSAAVLAACQGGSTYAPATATMNDAAQGSHFRAPLPAPFDKVSALQPDASGCDAPNMKIPGNYISMAAFGNQKGTTFTSTAGILSTWTLSKYTKGTKPTPGPSNSPTTPPTTGPTPKPVQVFYYTGTYTTKKSKQTGCAILFVTKSHKPIIKGFGSGFGGGNPQFSQPYVNSTETLFGSLSLTITGLSASGGHGNAVLKTMKGKAYDTATFTLTKRISSIF
jgi:hypothetical protein